MAQDDLTMRVRAQGTRTTKRDLDETGQAVQNLGKKTKATNEEAGAFNRVTSLASGPVKKLRSEVGGLAKSFIGFGLAFGTAEGIHKAIETTDDLVKSTVQLRHQFGLSIQAASGLAGVMQTRGLAPQGLRMGLIQLSRQMHAVADGNDQAAEAFHYLGINADDVTAALAAPDGLEKMFERVTGRMTEMAGGANKAYYGQQLLGRAQRSLAPLLQEGALGLRQQLKWAKEYGVTLDGKTIGSVEGMAAAQTQAQYAALGLQIQLGQFLAPALTTVNTTFASVVKSFRDGKPEGDKFSRTVYTIGKDLEPVGKDLEKVGEFLVKHPTLLQHSAVAFLLWKTGLLKLITFPVEAGIRGYITGRAYAAGLAKGMTEEEAAQAAGQRWFTGFSTKAGGLLRTWLPPVVGVTVAIDFAYHLNSIIAKWLNIPANGMSNNTATRLLNPASKPASDVLHGRNPLKGTIFDPSPSGPSGPFKGRLSGMPIDMENRSGTKSIGTLIVNRKGRITSIDPSFVGPGQPAHPHSYGGFAVGQRARVALGANGEVYAVPVEVVVHLTTNLDGKPIAKSTHRQAVKAKAVK